MKKLASILAISALALGGVALGAVPAMAGQAPTLGVSSSVIESGGAISFDFSALVPVAQNSCALFKQGGQVMFGQNGGESGQFSPTLSAPAGVNYGWNTNATASPITTTIGIYPIVSGLCTDLLALPNLPVATALIEWTVNPALSVAPIAPFTTGAQSSQTIATQVANPTAGPVDMTLASSWMVDVGAACPTSLVNAIAPPIDVALPAGLSIDGTVSAPGVVPGLTILGTPAAGTAGTYLVCLTRFDTNGGRVGALVTITVVDPVVAELAATGVDGMQDGVLAGGAALLALIGAAAFVLVRRRTASV